MWSFAPPALGLTSNQSLLVAGGGVALGIVLLLWGRRIRWLFPLVAGAWAGVTFVTPLAQKITGQDLRICQILAGVSAAVVAVMGTQFVWALLAGAIFASAATIVALCYYVPDVSAYRSALPKGDETIAVWAQAMWTFTRQVLEAGWKQNAATILLISCPPGLLAVVVGVLRPRVMATFMTALAGGVLIVCGAMVGMESLKPDWWRSGWANLMVPAIIAGSLALVGMVLQFRAAAARKKAAAAAAKENQGEPSRPAQ